VDADAPCTSATRNRLNPPPWGRNNAEVVITLFR
jgi:hypothetical protein